MISVYYNNNTIKTNYIKAKVANIGDKDKTINHINECSKLAQKEYKTRYDWVGKVINREFCKKFKFDHANKWYMHNPESVLENEIGKILRDYEIQTDHLILTRPRDSQQNK